MKIAYLTCVYPPYPGGIGVSAQNMAQEMAKRGHGVHVYTPHGGVKSQIPNPKSQTNSNYQNPKVHLLRPAVRWGNGAFLPQLLWKLRDFDIIHLLYPFYGVAELLPLIKKISRANIIVHHTMDAAYDGWLGHFFTWHTAKLMPRIFACADILFTLSEDFFRASSLAKVYQESDNAPPIGFVPNGVDTDLFHPAQELHTTSYLLPTILFVGGLDRAHYFKGVHVLLAALRMLQWGGVSFKCVIAGDGDLRKEYEAQAREADLLVTECWLGKHSVTDSHNTECFLGDTAAQHSVLGSGVTLAPGSVEFVGLVPHEKLPPYYQNAAICVVPSTAPIENFSITAAEAQACGIPVVVSDLPGVRLTIEDRVSGYLVRPGDPEDLATKIFYVLEDRARAEKMGEAGRARAVANFNMQVIGDKLQTIYENLRHP
ncbi:hypothetical protein A3B21_03025 [Candidatus Uhrbacteria bacterium RIFCSPLOWO2_01_FULL_47_24]|uniref:Uncharacterized protein n=1 Tax=Candidatus Uhrbacteria bacterium RIFCSPLOWO2_01_FULL_47_24 TaxID=1802401 RepID=A0A1F7URI4_9BACT|nr:MAG: hypothetical protein A2753_04950 [Candidatus Uhrbacteria bacterium RIFCSPHIGHO2_01_FULL_47_11]OGL67559.1 MAG: hypothetical protein A3D58_03625 [Candidatus Uhrbacteria bacterium RIFCSPHIGHO2_02_FULL_46_47]OGL75156.1 MAG: hypothetical protein A3F52_02640 [Candidatus Uhrbacteria bacterium RIFCSPHIGHO2_12_FULL_47_11]OGL80913.1 MAG: hypothetical protein A3B21_03025 [Candidatus Uhrbacteria bacterium RIFCSPLOWO2_01_FULL_47_24]OGL84248.1 MAG: hypothetical protein A3J03_03025 [Candidatus Uhrbact